MLTLSRDQFVELERNAAVKFVRRLLAKLETEYPDQLQQQPEFVRLTMVANGLQAGEGFGLTTERSLAAFVALQFETAPDFHSDPEINRILRSNVSESNRIDALTKGVSQERWDSIKNEADVMSWFESNSPEQLCIRIAARVCDCFNEVALAHTSDTLWQFFEAVPARARRHQLMTEEQLTVFAAALVVYGDQLDSAEGPNWAAPLFRSKPVSPDALVDLLRLRLLLDTERTV